VMNKLGIGARKNKDDEDEDDERDLKPEEAAMNRLDKKVNQKEQEINQRLESLFAQTNKLTQDQDRIRNLLK
jgi:uncharacterized protein (DUF3084 family)